MSFLKKFLRVGGHGKWLFIVAGIPLLYAAFIWGLSTNPGGFYYDEACEAYNGYLIATTGTAENGTIFPLFFQCYTGGFTQWMSPLLIYMMAGMYSVIPPSPLSAHVFSATLVFIAILFLGVLAARISGKIVIGVVVAITAMATPWLFEISRMVQETSALSLGIVLFLFCLYNPHRREKWKLSDNISLAFSLAMITYAYAAGRVLGPAFAFGLLIFAVNRRALIEAFKTWAIYFVTLIPFIVVYITNGDAITARFREVSYMTPDKSWWQIATEFVTYFFQDMSPAFLLLNGDHLYRHHIPVMGGIFVVTFLLAIVGLIIVLKRHRGNAWWRFILYGFFVSILPGALTVHRQHFLRLLAVPIILLILTVPALSFLISDADDSKKPLIPDSLRNLVRGRLLRHIILALLLLLTAVQAVYFQIQFQKWQPQRRSYFSWAYPLVLERALAEPLRPIYLQDGRYGPAYILALWYATAWGLDLANFVHLPEGAAPPADSLILGSVTECSNCYEIIGKESFLLYQTKGSAARPGILRSDSTAKEGQPLVPDIIGSEGSEPGQFSKPRGVASDDKGYFYVADSLNGRVQKFDSERKFVASFSKDVTGEERTMNPEGMAIDADGNLYVSDVANHKLIKFGPDGHFITEWRGPDTGFYGPRDIAIGANNQLFIVDSGRNRVVKFDAKTDKFTAWGTVGTAEGQFNGVSGIAIADDLVIVIDAGNKRVQAFDFEGNFVRQWNVDAWKDNPTNFSDAVFDKQTKVLYVSNELTRDVIAFDIDGNPERGISVEGKEKFSVPSAMSILETQKTRYLMVADTNGSRIFIFEIGAVKSKK